MAVDLASGIFLRGHSLLWSQPRQADKRTERPFIHRGAFGSPETLKPGLRRAGSASPAGAEMDSRQRENLGPGASRSQAAGPGVMGRRQLSGAGNGPPEPPPWSQLPSPATPPWGRREVLRLRLHLFTYSFTHSSSQRYLLSTYYVPGGYCFKHTPW